MHQIMVYADSLSWGIIPGTRRRFSFSERWPGVMELDLLKKGYRVRVIEDCLNGRRTVFEDPFKPGRNGREGVEQRIEANSPLSLVMIMLGTNDFQSVHQVSASHSAQGLAAIVRAIRLAPIEPGMPVPKIMLIAPPTIRASEGPAAEKFSFADSKSEKLPKAIRQVAKETDCLFFDASKLIESSKIDGVHLDADQHQTLGIRLAEESTLLLTTSSDQTT